MGKTTLACRLIKKILFTPEDPRDQLVIISPHFERDEKISALAKYVVERGLNVKIYPVISKTTMANIVKYLAECKKSGLRSTVFIDDPIGAGTFTSNVNQESPFNALVAGAKHFATDIIFSTQSVKGMAVASRKNVEVFIFLADIISRHELYQACRFVPTMSDFDRLMDVYTEEMFSALWINIQFGRRGVYHIDSEGSISPITSVPP